MLSVETSNTSFSARENTQTAVCCTNVCVALCSLNGIPISDGGIAYDTRGVSGDKIDGRLDPSKWPRSGDLAACRQSFQKHNLCCSVGLLVTSSQCKPYLWPPCLCGHSSACLLMMKSFEGVSVNERGNKRGSPPLRPSYDPCFCH